ncbi:beta-ketoacyl synthase N-terminal-like domain-containing protein [Chryseobacterium sp. MYb264]|uniref:beta-ketoacyl synthase N-terminal-like domain-containing protein n=1 Tax=Chryseobacterium sp. MYb264 TaxID=2745153 RepID=UPI002E114ACA|nr:beta-ketoacyl synthase N-terminal-like domain-containing protein [Chryseobacterium sp. MYb264]
MSTRDNKVVVTAMGVCSPLGNSVEKFIENYKKYNAEISFKINDHLLEEELSAFKKVNQRRMDRVTRIAMLAAASCLRDSGLEIDGSNIHDVGGIFSTEYGPIASARDFINSGFELGLNSASPLLFPYTVGNAAPGAITILMGARGFNTTLSGHNPVAYTYDVISSGKAKAILAGGFEELVPEIEESYSKRTISKQGIREAAPIRRLSEGSAMLFLESEAFARSRKAEVLFEVCGYGVSSNLQKDEVSIDNFGYVAPHIIVNTMASALKRSGVDAGQISLIVSLSRDDSHQVNSEETAVKSIWNEDSPHIHYIKQKLGETFGSSGCFATIVGYLIGLDFKTSSDSKKWVMINSYHIGGNCVSVIIAI